MKVLFVAPWIPSRFRPRSLGILEWLIERYDVRVLALGNSNESTDDLLALAGVESTVIPVRTWAARGRVIAALFTGESLQCSYVNEPAFRRALSELLHEYQPDVVHFNVVRASVFLDEVNNVPVVYDLDEIRSDYYVQLSRNATALHWRALGRIEAPRLRSAETTVATASTAILVSSPFEVDDGRHLVRSPQSAVKEAGEHLRVPSSVLSILFVGRMSYYPNVLSIRWFVDRVMPLVLQREPTAVLNIVGERPSRGVRRIANAAVRVHGRVDSVEQFYAKATVAVVPLEIGTGVQMKLVQALIAGVPTVATRRAASRAGVVADKHVIVAGTPDEWADSIVRLYRDRQLAERVAACGMRWALSEYSRPRIASALAETYNVVEGAQ